MCNLSYSIGSCFKRSLQQLSMTSKHVTFATTHKVFVFPSHAIPVVLTTLNSGAGGHYLSERDQVKANLPILRPSTKRVGVANGECSKAKHITVLPLPNLSPQAEQVDSFDDFSNSLISVGRLADNGTISIFTKVRVTVHKVQDVLITCHSEPILIGGT